MGDNVFIIQIWTLFFNTESKSRGILLTTKVYLNPSKYELIFRYSFFYSYDCSTFPCFMHSCCFDNIDFNLIFSVFITHHKMIINKYYLILQADFSVVSETNFTSTFLEYVYQYFNWKDPLACSHIKNCSSTVYFN